MRICILTSSYPVAKDITIGGVASFERDIALELVENGNEIHIIAPAQPGEDFNDPTISIHRFSWLGCKQGRELSSLKLSKLIDLLAIISIIINGQFALINLHRKKKIDICYSMWAVPAGFWAMFFKSIKKVPYVVWTLGSDIWDYGRKKSTKWIIKRILKNADKLYSDGYSLARETSALGGQFCDFLPSTRDLKNISPNTNFFKYNKEKKNYLFVGRYHKNKGPDILIRSISKLSKEVKRKTNFYFFGGGDMEHDLRGLKRKLKLNNIFINGFVGPEEIVYLLDNADFLIIPSREDSIPVILSDATQFHLPIIATDVGDTGSLVREFNIGSVVESENADQLASAIEKTIDKTKSDYKSGLERINNKFRIEQVAKKMSEDFLQLI